MTSAAAVCVCAHTPMCVCVCVFFWVLEPELKFMIVKQTLLD